MIQRAGKIFGYKANQLHKNKLPRRKWTGYISKEIYFYRCYAANSGELIPIRLNAVAMGLFFTLPVNTRHMVLLTKSAGRLFKK